MARQLPLGRITKTQIPDSVRRSGVFASFGDKGFFGEYFDQLMFEAHQIEHILGNAAQLASDFATMTWSNSNSRFENKAGGLVTLGDYERIAIIGMDTLTANMVIDNVKGLEIKHIGATPGQSGDNPKLQLGDAGGGEPFKILLGADALDCKLDLLTDKPFAELELSNLTLAQKQYVANQGKGNFIKVNGERIYNPSEAGQIVKYDTRPGNPYLLRMDGTFYPYGSDVATDNLAWFRDLNVALGGQRWDGTKFVEVNSRFSLNPTLVFFRINSANRFFTDISSLDTRIHSRTDPTGVNIAAIADFVNTSNVVTFQGGAGNIKNGMRINLASSEGIPDGAVGTTILKNINTATGTAEMIDALTGAAVPATATFNGRAVEIDNSGAAGGSHDDDAFQNHRHHIAHNTTLNAADPLIDSENTLGRELSQGAPFSYQLKQEGAGFLPAVSGPTSLPIALITDPAAPNLHDQTQPRSSAVYFYYKV